MPETTRRVIGQDGTDITNLGTMMALVNAADTWIFYGCQAGRSLLVAYALATASYTLRVEVVPQGKNAELYGNLVYEGGSDLIGSVPAFRVMGPFGPKYVGDNGRIEVRFAVTAPDTTTQHRVGMLLLDNGVY